jgi:trk system potassium uptake protein TrkA
MNIKPTEHSTGTTVTEDADGDWFVLGGEHLGAAIARRLQIQGIEVTLVDESHDSREIPGVQGDPENMDLLSAAGRADASKVIVATEKDTKNLLISQLVDTTFDVDDILVLVNIPERNDLVEASGHEPICTTSALSEAVVGTIEPRILEEETTT